MIRFVVQARMNSSRLPGKILAEIHGQPLLWHVLTRLKAACEILGECGDSRTTTAHVVVATTDQPADDHTAAWCRGQGVACYRGSSQDVLKRYIDSVADLGDSDILIRATADNPLYCPHRAAAIVIEHLQAQVDYTCIAELSYVVPEVMQVGALRQMAKIAHDAYCREHVTPFFRQPDSGFRVLQLPAVWRGLLPEIRLTVDTPAELAAMRRLVACCHQGDPLFPLARVYAFQRQRMRLAA